MVSLIMHLFLLMALFTSCIYPTAAFLDPISIGVGIGSLGFSGFKFAKDQTYCRMVECCDERSIPGNLRDLDVNLKYNLFGQHIVHKHLVAALEAHFSKKSESKKPLVISFHGTPGTGKNFVADMVAQTLYKNGLKSKFVHKYLGRADFPLTAKADSYKERIDREVRQGIAECPRSLFIFDEVDKMPTGVFDSLTSLVDYNTITDGHDYTKAIFLFLTNTAGVQISDRLGNLIKKGQRADSKLSDFEQILQKAAYNMEGGMQRTGLIEAHVIDHYLPFLPLEKEHVVECVKAEYRRWRINSPKDSAIENIIKNVVTYDRTHGLFATSGCKTLEKKVAVDVAMANKNI